MCGAISIIFDKPGNALTLALSLRERGLVTHPLSDDLQSFQVGANPRTENDAETCDIVVRNMAFKEDDPTGNTGSRARIPSVNYQDWWVEALAKVVGLNSIDDLTKTRTSLEFTRTPTSVFGGSNPATNCWGNHIPPPPFFDYVDDCYVNSLDFLLRLQWPQQRPHQAEG